MDASEIIQQFPYPIAVVYHMIDDESRPWLARREALSFTVYQLMRTVGLTLVGQYLTQEPPDGTDAARTSLNEAITRLRSPHFNDWIGLLGALKNQEEALKLDFFPELKGALASAAKIKVPIPDAYRGNEGSPLPLFQAFRDLRNGSSHSGVSGEDICQEAVAEFRPHLDTLLAEFAFLTKYDLLVLAAPYNAMADDVTVQILRGTVLPEPQDLPRDSAFTDAFSTSPAVMRGPTGRVQALFPLFHAHLEGEPLHYYDGHNFSKERRTIYYLGSSTRFPLDEQATAESRLRPDGPSDAAARLDGLLARRDVRWETAPAQVTPWMLRDIANYAAHRTLTDQIGIKYLPQCYLDRPVLSGPLWNFVSEPTLPEHRAFLLSGRAGSGKTALLCDTVRRLLESGDKPVVFFVRGAELIDYPGSENVLLSNLLYKLGIKAEDNGKKADPGAILKFETFGQVFTHLAGKRADDEQQGRRMVLAIDAINESLQSSLILREALEMVEAARRHDWLRIVLSARTEFLDVWRGKSAGNEPSPFYAVKPLFVLPDASQPPSAPEDPPAWVVPAFKDAEAETVYGNYRREHRTNPAVKACRTAWDQVATETRAKLLITPLYLDLWMTTFNDQDALPLTGEKELFDRYLADLRDRFHNFWPGMQLIIQRLLDEGRIDLGDEDAHAVYADWIQRYDSNTRVWHLPPVETACVAGVMQKQITTGGNVYRIPFQRLREVLIYQHLKPSNLVITQDHLRQWLSYPPTDDLEGALSQIAEDLWKADRSAELVVFIEQYDVDGSGIGWRALSRMLARRLERHEETPLFQLRLNRLCAVVPADDALSYHLATLLVFDVPGRIAGLSLTEGKTGLFACVSRWMEARQFGELGSSWQRTLSVSYNKLGDLARNGGDSRAALDWYGKGLEIAQRLYDADRGNADFARDLSISYNNLGDLARYGGDSDAALDWFMQAKAIRQRLYDADRGNADFARDLSVSYDRLARLGDLARYGGDSRAALDWFMQAKAIRQRLYDADRGNADFARDLSISYNNLGELARNGGDSDAALDWFMQAKAIRQRLYEADPGNAGFARGLSVSYERLGDMARDGENSDAALDWFMQAKDIRQSLYDADRGNADFARGLSISYERLGDMARNGGDSRAALDWYGKGLEIAQRLYDADRGNADFARGLSISYERLGDMARDGGNSDAALDWYQKGLEIAQSLYDADRGNAGYARGLSISYERLGDMARDGENSDAALDWFMQAKDIRQSLYDADRGNADFARDLSVSYERLGDLARNGGDSRAALDWYGKGLEIAQRLYDADRGNADFARDLSVSYDRLARLDGGLETQEGREWFKQARAILRLLRAQGRMPDKEISEYLDWLEANLDE